MKKKDGGGEGEGEISSASSLPQCLRQLARPVSRDRVQFRSPTWVLAVSRVFEPSPTAFQGNRKLESGTDLGLEPSHSDAGVLIGSLTCQMHAPCIWFQPFLTHIGLILGSGHFLVNSWWALWKVRLCHVDWKALWTSVHLSVLPRSLYPLLVLWGLWPCSDRGECWCLPRKLYSCLFSVLSAFAL